MEWEREGKLAVGLGCLFGVRLGVGFQWLSGGEKVGGGFGRLVDGSVGSIVFNDTSEGWRFCCEDRTDLASKSDG